MRPGLRRLSAAADARRVALVYGSFCTSASRLDCESIAAATSAGFDVGQPTEGAAFDFDTLLDSHFLIVSTSSWLGMPPKNLVDFAHQLLLVAETNPGGLSHLQHAVWGRGDERWLKTYMSVPRFVDQLLSAAGSRRFFARGEIGEPHAPTQSASCTVEEWAAAVWPAMAAADANAPPVAWDAQWDERRSPHHERVVPFALHELVGRHGAARGGPSSLATPTGEYWRMLEAWEERQRAREAAAAERARSLKAKAAARKHGAPGGVDGYNALLRTSGAGGRSADELLRSRRELLLTVKGEPEET